MNKTVFCLLMMATMIVGYAPEVEYSGTATVGTASKVFTGPSIVDYSREKDTGVRLVPCPDGIAGCCALHWAPISTEKIKSICPVCKHGNEFAKPVVNTEIVYEGGEIKTVVKPGRYCFRSCRKCGVVYDVMVGNKD